MLMLLEIYVLVFALCINTFASARQLDSREGVIVHFADVQGLAVRPNLCKPPASIKKTTQEIPPFNRRNWYRFIDLDGDGVCEVQYETCNVSSGVGRLKECDPWNWLYAVKWDGKEWKKPMPSGTSTTAIYRGSTVMLYFNAATKKVEFKFEFPYYEMPRVEWTYYPQSSKAGPQKDAAPSSIEINYDFDYGPYQHHGALIPLLDVHIRRILSEVKWRTKNCGGENGYLDEETRTATLDDLERMVSIFLPRAEYPPPASLSRDLVKVADSWRSVSENVFQVIPSRNSMHICSRGYKEIVTERG